MILPRTLERADAVVVAWLPGTGGDGVADVLFGDHPPTGRLSFSWPRSSDQIPIHVGDASYDAFPVRVRTELLRHAMRTAAGAGAALVAVSMAAGCVPEAVEDPTPYEPTWSSLAEHEAAPGWFRDAKFGIYLHWGALSVPAAFHDWYPRMMHIQGSDEHAHQVETYGPLDAFGYHDFVPMFTAEHFDPEEWAALFQRAGARFAGMVAEHHDGFSMWDSEINPWNAADRGPERDLVGALQDAVHGRGMRFVTSFHMARNLQIYQDRPQAGSDTSYFPYVEGWATASEDPELRMMYGNLPVAEFAANWEGKLREVIDGYRPDLIYFDGMLPKIPEPYMLRFLAHYFNSAERWGRDVVVTYKNDELPSSLAVPDYEKGRVATLAPEPFLTDETISNWSWSYVEGLTYKSVPQILHILADVVSKNGSLMLNISPRADGTIPEEQREILQEIGDWLAVHGEAIYGTRPWVTYGEGPTVQEEGGHFLPTLDYRPEDIRYTSRGDTVYATALGWPGPGARLTLGAFSGPAANTEVRSVELVGTDAALTWERTAEGLQVTLPDRPVSGHATVLRIETAPAPSR